MSLSLIPRIVIYLIVGKNLSVASCIHMSSPFFQKIVNLFEASVVFSREV